MIVIVIKRRQLQHEVVGSNSGHNIRDVVEVLRGHTLFASFNKNKIITVYFIRNMKFKFDIFFPCPLLHGRV